jgi:hypothetical protein
MAAAPPNGPTAVPLAINGKLEKSAITNRKEMGE